MKRISCLFLLFVALVMVSGCGASLKEMIPSPDYARFDLSYARELEGVLSLKEADYRISSANLMLGWHIWENWPIELGVSGRRYSFQIDGPNHLGFREHSYSVGPVASIAREFRFFGNEDIIISFRIYGSLGKMWPDEELPGLNGNSILGDFGGIIGLEFPLNEDFSAYAYTGGMHESKFSAGDTGLNTLVLGIGIKYYLPDWLHF